MPGTLSVTATDLFFDADEEHPLYKKQDPKVCEVTQVLLKAPRDTFTMTRSGGRPKWNWPSGLRYIGEEIRE